MEIQNEEKQLSKTVLVVDDEISLLESISLKLKRAGYIVLKASDGATGLELALSNHPDLILLDVQMPRMDGFTMLHKLRADTWGMSASVIILTNQEADDVRLSHVASDQPAYYLVKANVTLDQIIEKVKEIFLSKESAV